MFLKLLSGRGKMSIGGYQSPLGLRDFGMAE